MTKEKQKKGFVLRALDTVERVGNGLPNPDVYKRQIMGRMIPE